MNTLSYRLWFTGALALGSAGTVLAQDYVPGEIIVKYRPVGTATASLARTAIGARLKRQLPSLRMETIKLRPGMSVPQALAYYRRLSGVEYAEPNYRVYADFTPNDTLYDQQWALAKVNAPRAWDISLGDPTVKIAILDTGVDYNHPDLAGKVIKGRDTVDNDDDPMGDHYHGTHVAGIAAAVSNNNRGIAGMGFNSTIIAVKVLSETAGSVDTVIAGMQNAAELGANVINMSLGFYLEGSESQVFEDAVDAAWNQGIVVVATAGNNNISTRRYPGAAANSIGVAATDEGDRKADFSNFGVDWVDVAAPGVDILSTVFEGQYATESGTSMAAPLVAGLAGLLKGYAPNATNAQIRTAIEQTTVPVVGTPFSRFGRVSAINAINAVVRPLNVLASPSAVAIYRDSVTQGRNMLGKVEDLAATDGKSVSVETIYQPGNGLMAALQTSIPFDQDPVRFVSGTLAITHTSRREATVSVFLLNNQTNRYDVVKSFPGTSVSTTSAVTLPSNLDAYLRDGRLSAVVRAYVPKRLATGIPAFRLTVDRVHLNALVLP